jgi:hypothetical protein
LHWAEPQVLLLAARVVRVEQHRGQQLTQQLVGLEVQPQQRQHQLEARAEQAHNPVVLVARVQ